MYNLRYMYTVRLRSKACQPAHLCIGSIIKISTFSEYSQFSNGFYSISFIQTNQRGETVPCTPVDRLLASGKK